MLSKPQKTLLAILGASVILPHTVDANTKYWLDTTAQPFWNINENWSPLGVPSQIDNVRIIAARDPVTIPSNSPQEISSLVVNGGSVVRLESDLDIQTRARFGGDVVMSLNNSAHLAVGTAVPGSDRGAFTLTRNSRLELLGEVSDAAQDRVSFYGPLIVDKGSEIAGHGIINTYSDIDLNGRLFVNEYMSTLTINSICADGEIPLIDLDGSDDTGTLDISLDESTLELPAQLADPYSGSIRLGAKSTLKFMGQGTTEIDGSVYASYEFFSFSAEDAPVIEGGDLVFLEGSRIETEWFGHIAIKADTLNIFGSIFLPEGSSLDVETDGPWRLGGAIDTVYGATVSGSPVIVGSLDDRRIRIDASFAQFHFNTAAYLENSVSLEGMYAPAARGGFGSFVFSGPLTLNSPRINDPSEVQVGEGYILGPISISSGLNVVGSTTVTTSALGLGAGELEIAPGQVLTIDAFILTTSTSGTMEIKPNAVFDVKIRSHLDLDFDTENAIDFLSRSSKGTSVLDQVDRSWVNNMSIELDNGFFDAGIVCHRGAITGVGGIQATFLDVHDDEPCLGSIAPGSPLGALRFEGDVSFTGAEFNMEIGGDNVLVYDRLVVSGGIQIINGVLNINFVDDYSPHAGDEIMLFSSSSPMALDFSHVNFLGLPSDMSYDSEMLTKGVLKFKKADENVCK